jgi:hypothetical protein
MVWIICLLPLFRQDLCGHLSVSSKETVAPVQDISQDTISLTDSLNSMATVNQAVVQTLHDLKTGKSSSNSRFPVHKILPYEGKCQLGDCYTCRPAAL